MKYAISLSLVFAATVATLCLALGDPAGDAPEPRVAAPLSAASPPAARPGPDDGPDVSALPRRGFEPGVTYRYAYESRQQVRIENTEAAEEGQTVDYAIRGRVRMTPIAREGDVVHVEVGFEGLSLDRPGMPADHPLHDEIGQPFVVSMSADGRLEAMHVPPGWSFATRSVAKSVVASMQVVCPDDAGARWPSVEQDTNGEFVATYVRRADAGGEPRIRKTREGYQRVVTVGGLAPAEDGDTITLAGGLDIALGAHGWPTSLVGAERSTVSMQTLRIETLNRLSISLVERSPGRTPTLSLWRMQTTAIAGIDELAGADHEADRQEAAGATAAELLAALEGFTGADHEAHRGEIAALVGRMAAALRLTPGEAAALAGRVRGEGSAKLKRVLLNALSEAGTPEAQAELAGLARDRELATDYRRSSAIGLGLTSNPTAASGEALLALARGEAGDVDEALRSTATLAMGNLERRAEQARQTTGTDAALDGDDAAEPASMVDELLAMLDRATSVGEQAICIMALGNTGSPEALPTLDHYAADPGPLQGHAVHALRFIALPEVDVRVRDVLRSGSPDARRAALGVVPFRSMPTYWPVLADLMRVEPGPGMRRAVVGLAAAYLDHPGARALLVAAAETDADGQVRTLAGQALAAAAAR